MILAEKFMKIFPILVLHENHFEGEEVFKEGGGGRIGLGLELIDDLKSDLAQNIKNLELILGKFRHVNQY